MAITLPIELVVAPGSTDAAIRKATADAGKALEAAAKEEAKRLAYIDGLKQRYFTDEQRRRDQEVRAEERAQAQMLAAEQRRATQAEALNSRMAASEAAAAARLDAAIQTVKGAVSGLSTEEIKLQAIQKQAAELFKRGAISAEKYAVALGQVGARQNQLRDATLGQVGAAGKAETSTRAVGAAMGNLRSQLIDVGVGLQGGQNPLTILSQQGPQIAEALSSAKGAAAAAAGAIGSLLQVLAPLALALSPLIVGWLDYAQAQKLAMDAANTFREAQDSTLGLLEKSTEDVHKLTQIQRGYSDVEKQADEITRGYARAREEANAKHQEAITVLSAQLGLTDDLAAVNAELIAQGKDEVKSVSKTSAAWEKLHGKLQGHVDAMNDVDRAAGDGAAAALLVLEYTTQQTESESTLAAAIRDRAKAQKQAAKDAKKDAKDEEAFLNGVDALIGSDFGLDLAATTAVLAAQEVDNAVADIKAGVDSVGNSSEAAAAKMAGMTLDPDVVLGGIRALEGGLQGIATLIGGPVAGAVVGLVLDLEDTIGSLTEELLALPEQLKALPKLLTGLVVTVVDEVVPALMGAAPQIAEGFALAVTSPEFLTALSKAAIYFTRPIVQVAFWAKVGANIVKGFWDAFLQGWESFTSGAMFAGFIDAFQMGWDHLFSGHFVSDLVEGFVEAAKAFVGEVKDSLTSVFSKDESGTTGAGDALREVFTLGQAETRFGDTPGIVRWGDRGPADFADDDWVAAARSREELRRMTGGGQQASGPMTVDLADGHLAFDGQLRRATKQPRTRRELFGFTPARKLA